MKNIKPIKLLKVLSFLLLFTTLSCVDSDQFISEASDTDGDGILNSLDEAPNNPCLPAQQMEYTGFDVFNEAWASADCDGDGISNGAEFEDKTRNPFLDENTVDTDGDGVADFLDEDANDPCIPVKEEGYVGFNSDNELWLEGDCDGDTIPNGVEFANGTDPYKACNLNFDITNYVKELRTVDSNNGEGITIGKLGVECGEYIFTGGGIFNQGCFNDNVEILFVFTPNASDSSEGTITVPSTTYSCVSEDGTETTQFTVEGTGSYQGELERAELNYTMTTPDGTIEGTLKIRGLDDEGDDDDVDDDCNLDFDFSNFEGELLANDSNNGENLVIGSLLDSCNEISISGDFLNLGCTNGDIEILVFLDPFEEGGSEGNAIVENATFTCSFEDGTSIMYTFTSFGSFNGDNGTIELSEYTLTGGSETITGTVSISKSLDDDDDDDDDGNGDGEEARCTFASGYNTIINTDNGESFGSGTLTQNPDVCNEYVLSGDFLGLGCTNDLSIEVFFGEEEGGSEVIISETTFICESNDGSSVEYTFRAFGNYSVAEGFIEFSEFSLTDASGNETNGTIFFERGE